jgi:hypothetical protein
MRGNPNCNSFTPLMLTRSGAFEPGQLNQLPIILNTRRPSAGTTLL